MRGLLIVGVLALCGCEAVVVRCPASTSCKGGDIETCRVDCDRNGNNCDLIHTTINCTGSCTETANGAACIDGTATCNSSTDLPRCQGDAIVRCNNNHVSTTPCPMGMTCHRDQVSDPFCVDSPKVTCDPAAYPVCVDDITIQQCIGGGPDGYAVATQMCTTMCVGGAGSAGYCN